MKPSKQFPQRNTSSASASRTTAAPLIYAVDDAPDLTGLYAALLGATGYIVRAFNDRAEALAALKEARTKPALLITDYRGLSIPIDQFMCHCLAVHPALRILMASGYSHADVGFSQATPDRFIQKPFTPEELQQEVKAALASRRLTPAHALQRTWPSSIASGAP
jgi:DNA-binding NtrC family response regulator